MDKTLERIYISAVKFLTPLSLEETYSTIIKEAIQFVDGRHGSILLEKDGVLYRAYTSFSPLYSIKIRPHGDTYAVFKSNRAQVFAIEKLKKNHPVFVSTRAKSEMMIPLSYQRKSIGVLTIYSKPHKEFTHKDLKILKYFVPLATLAIKKSQYSHEIQNALETRDLFISLASHELKTPLTTIKVYSQLVHKKIDKQQTLDPRWVNRLLNEVTRLTKLVNELLQVEQIKKGQLQYAWKECSIREIAQRAVTDFEMARNHHKVKYKDLLNSHGDTVRADYEKLLQAIINLLNNAAKFSPKKSDIHVSLTYKTPHFVIRVKDHGKGIAKKDIKNIFDRFYKGEAKEEGMGLGLYLTKQIIEEHNGEIKVNSRLNKGTEVEVRIPQVQ